MNTSATESETPPRKSVLFAMVQYSFLGALGTIASLKLSKHLTHNPSKLNRGDLITTGFIAGLTGMAGGLTTAKDNNEIDTQTIR